MGHLDYYEDFTKDEINHDPWLIIITEAKYHYETKNRKWIQYTELESNSDEMLNYFSKGSHSAFGGSFPRHIKKYSDPSTATDRRFFRREMISHKNVRIHINIKRINIEIESRKNRNLENRNDLPPLLTVRHKRDQWIR